MDEFNQQHGGSLAHEVDETRVVSLDAVRRQRASRGSAPSIQMSPDIPVAPDLATLARAASFAERRRKLADAMAVFSGAEPDAQLLEHQMIVTGLAAGHGCAGGEDDDNARPLGNAMDDPAVVVGLVLHYARHNAGRGLPIPRTVVSQLDRHVALGSAAARLVRDWLNARSVRCGKRRLWVHDGGKA